MEQNQRFEALSRLCLNNWHYIDKKILSFNEMINFFTGHSGSGKSTIIDALQVLLYANTDGRNFFNKAATDDSDRTLIEYLRGMINIKEDNEYTYLRNRNFSTTIVMELQRTDTGEKQCIGAVFDVITATNESSKMFFWHKGPLPDSYYRTTERTMSIDEVKEFIRNNYLADQYYFESTNERFRTKLYDVYLGGLNQERFPQLFKKAIPFKIDIKLSEFVKEYICIEQDTNIEDMQESVTQYGRMCRQIKDIQEEVKELSAIQHAFDEFSSKEVEARKLKYFVDSLELMEIRQQEETCKLKDESYNRDLVVQNQSKDETGKQMKELEDKKEELIGKISASGYDSLLNSMETLNQLIQKLSQSKGNWIRTANGLKEWEAQDITPNAILWAIDDFKNFRIKSEEIIHLKASLEAVRKDIRQQKNGADTEVKKLDGEKKELQEEMKELKQGKPAYPKELENARRLIQEGLRQKTGRSIKVEVLADLIEVEDEAWRNAVEGYMASNKLMLIVPPDYAKAAMELYRKLDKKEYHRVSVLDTEKISGRKWDVKPNALSREVSTKIGYVQAYIDYLMGRVIKCNSIEELRRQHTGITRDCELYSGFRYQHINPAHYTRYAYIGEISRKQRIEILKDRIIELEKKIEPQVKISQEAEKILELERLQGDSDLYIGWLNDVKEIKEKERERNALENQINDLKEKNVDAWKLERLAIDVELDEKKKQNEALLIEINKTKQKIDENNRECSEKGVLLTQKEKAFKKVDNWEEEVTRYLGKKEAKGSTNYSNLRINYQGRHTTAVDETEELMKKLREERLLYLKRRPNRSFALESRENAEYEQLLRKLQYDDLDALYQKASDQAKDAIEMFKNDFVFKIRSAIKNAMEQKDQLNKIISRLEFGKDCYKFVIEKNKGADGRFYPMFMDENLEIKPSSLKNSMENQLDIFSMSHEAQYGDLIAELINIFIPPENATSKELEEAKKNMEKYADYRTYLSFDMEQIIKNDDEQINIKLGRMIRKNSGGEGQNPLYVALLASFAQAYRIDLSPKLQRNPTIRLVILDEAFSKMDAEKVASCIELIQDFGFQAIISSTNDKIQSYLDSVNKTFVFANPSKKHISIQEFERKDFDELRSDI